MKKVRNEIGSEFWDVPTGPQNDLFCKDIQWLLSGRNALKRIIEESGIQSVALPAWCCDSMIKPFHEANVEVRFYPVYFNGKLVQNISNVDADGILVMDYFGYTGQIDASGFSGVVIRDVTHSVFSKAYNDADYYFGSLRKWAGFWTGGFGIGLKESNLCENEQYVKLRQHAMEEKSLYISGISQSKQYLDMFGQAEELLDQAHDAAASPDDVKRAHSLDLNFLKTKRRENAQRLLDTFSDIAIFSQMGEQDCPLFVPVLVPDGKRDALRRYLISNEIYCPVHWPVSAYHKLDDQTVALYENELSLVCDQRYTVQDMDRMITVIKNFWKECR